MYVLQQWQKACGDQSQPVISDTSNVKDADLHKEEVIDERKKQHLFIVPHLSSVDLNSASELPPLATVLHKDLEARKPGNEQKQTLLQSGLGTKTHQKYHEYGNMTEAVTPLADLNWPPSTSYYLVTIKQSWDPLRFTAANKQSVRGAFGSLIWLIAMLEFIPAVLRA